MKISDFLIERLMKIEMPVGMCIVHQNPPVQNIIRFWENSKFGIIRGLIVDNTSYWWDAYFATHHDIASELGIKLVGNEFDDEDQMDPRRLMISKEGDGTPYLTVHKNMAHHPQVEKLLQNNSPIHIDG